MAAEGTASPDHPSHVENLAVARPLKRKVSPGIPDTWPSDMASTHPGVEPLLRRHQITSVTDLASFTTNEVKSEIATGQPCELVVALLEVHAHAKVIEAARAEAAGARLADRGVMPAKPDVEDRTPDRAPSATHSGPGTARPTGCSSAAFERKVNDEFSKVKNVRLEDKARRLKAKLEASRSVQRVKRSSQGKRLSSSRKESDDVDDKLNVWDNAIDTRQKWVRSMSEEEDEAIAPPPRLIVKYIEQRVTSGHTGDVFKWMITCLGMDETPVASPTPHRSPKVNEQVTFEVFQLKHIREEAEKIDSPRAVLAAIVLYSLCQHSGADTWQCDSLDEGILVMVDEESWRCPVCRRWDAHDGVARCGQCWQWVHALRCAERLESGWVCHQCGSDVAIYPPAHESELCDDQRSTIGNWADTNDGAEKNSEPRHIGYSAVRMPKPADTLRMCLAAVAHHTYLLLERPRAVLQSELVEDPQGFEEAQQRAASLSSQRGMKFVVCCAAPALNCEGVVRAAPWNQCFSCPQYACWAHRFGEVSAGPWRCLHCGKPPVSCTLPWSKSTGEGSHLAQGSSRQTKAPVFAVFGSSSDDDTTDSDDDESLPAGGPSDDDQVQSAQTTQCHREWVLPATQSQE